MGLGSNTELSFLNLTQHQVPPTQSKMATSFPNVPTPPPMSVSSSPTTPDRETSHSSSQKSHLSYAQMVLIKMQQQPEPHLPPPSLRPVVPETKGNVASLEPGVPEPRGNLPQPGVPEPPQGNGYPHAGEHVVEEMKTPELVATPKSESQSAPEPVFHFLSPKPWVPGTPWTPRVHTFFALSVNRKSVLRDV